MKAFLDIYEPLVDTGQTWTFGQPSPPKHHNHMDFRRLKIRHVTFFMWTLVDNSEPNSPLCTRDLWMCPQRLCQNWIFQTFKKILQIVFMFDLKNLYRRVGPILLQQHGKRVNFTRKNSPKSMRPSSSF